MARMIFKNNAWHLSDDWSIDDVRCVIDCSDIEAARGFTDGDCVKVLEWVAKAFDANFGINWSAIEAAVDMVAREKLEEVPDALV